MTRKETAFAAIGAAGVFFGVIAAWEWDRPAMVSDIEEAAQALEQGHSPMLDAAERGLEDRAIRNRNFKAQVEREIQAQGIPPTMTQQKVLNDLDAAYQKEIDTLQKIRARK